MVRYTSYQTYNFKSLYYALRCYIYFLFLRKLLVISCYRKHVIVCERERERERESLYYKINNEGFCFYNLFSC